MAHNTEPDPAGDGRLDSIRAGASPDLMNAAGETAPSVDDIGLVPEVVEIRLDYTKDAVQMAKGGCRRWK